MKKSKKRFVARQLAGPALEVMQERRRKNPRLNHDKNVKTTLAHVSDQDWNADGLLFIIIFFLLHARKKG